MRVDVGDGQLEVEVLGQGEPVVVIQTALGADELRPLAVRLAAGGSYRVVHYHRRGYAGSDSPAGPSSIDADAAECSSLLRALGAAPAHVIGASYSAAVALTLASSRAEVVRTVTVVEPPPVHVASASEFRAANTALLHTARSRGAVAAVEELMTLLIGTDWRQVSEEGRPGSVAAMERDALTFVGHDVPALLTWSFGAAEAAALRCPVLHIGGGDSGPWFDQVRTWLLGLLPHAESSTVAGAGHLVPSTHPQQTADVILEFLDRHRSRTRSTPAPPRPTGRPEDRG